MTWTAQAHDRQGWWNASAANYADLRAEIVAECEAGHLYGPLYVTTPEGEEFGMSRIFASYGLKNVSDRPEPMIDEDEEADA